ncbi:MAG TPA: PfkB family carbohydrate kinase, partial [Flexilinea sp.]|nr:PfkB family carbohydrate kinase [Flexilinea sp.]
MNQPKICVAGSSNMDLVTSVKRMPLPGETIHGIDFHTFFGGKGANQAIMAAKLGGRVTMIAKVGNDGFGQQYLENYQSSGLVTDYVSVTDEAPTGIAAITVDEQGQNSIIVVSGANFAMTPSDIEKATPAIRE